LTSKDQAFSTFKEFRQQIEIEMRMKLRMLKTDRGGVEEGSKACRLYDPIAKKKHVSRDVKFIETKRVDTENTTPVNTEINDNIDDTYQEPDPINDPNSPITPPSYTYNPHSEEEEEATTSSAKNSGNRFDDTPVRGFKDLNEIYESTQEVEIGNLLLIEEEPCNYKEASTDNKWIKAMEIDMDSINKNNTWTLTTLPPEQKAIGLKWVYKTKRDAEGKIIKYKARLVAKGYEEVYVTQPEGFVQQGNPGKVYKLIKALYRLRQAPRAWNVKLDQTLKSLDFKKCNLKQVVYTRRSKTSTLIVGVYVDDLIITGTPRKIHARPGGSSPEGGKASNPIYQRNKGAWHNIQERRRLQDYRKKHKPPTARYAMPMKLFFPPSQLLVESTMALSSCESEFMAATGAACQALWLKRLLSELTGWKEERITMKVDNISAIALVRNPIFHGRSRHIDIRYHFIRECVENGHINVEHVSGELQRADILTKALPRLKFMTMRQMLGVQDLGRSNDRY
nr:ribonuclease H-like domain, reverse transcriptase, RNA-dependent DNA polymerase [Tanacetum cinerariifolium]